MADVAWSRSAIKTLARIDRTTAARIQAKVRQLAKDPQSLANNIRPLKGERDLMRLRVGNWRVIYTPTLTVLTVVKVAPRGGAYE